MHFSGIIACHASFQATHLLGAIWSLKMQRVKVLMGAFARGTVGVTVGQNIAARRLTMCENHGFPLQLAYGIAC
jgi:hypothetical protein